MNDQASEFLQLSKRYSSMYDEELLQLAGDFDNLTDVAQRALNEELKLRKLTIPQPGAHPVDEPSDPHAQVSTEWDMAPDGDILLGKFSSAEEAQISYWALELEGIHSRVVTPAASPNLAPRLKVSPEDATRAQQVLAQPISAEVMEQYESAKETGDFQSPDCPRCGTPDPLLESADPVNEWFCESCGHQWKDEPAESQENAGAPGSRS
jgi:hypothetical protein